MLQDVGVETLGQLIDQTVPLAIRSKKLDLPEGLSEFDALQRLKDIADKIKFSGLIWDSGITTRLLLL